MLMIDPNNKYVDKNKSNTEKEKNKEPKSQVND